MFLTSVREMPRIDVSAIEAPQIRSSGEVSNVPRAAAGCRSRHSPSCFCGDGGLCTWAGSVRRAKGNAATSHDRLDLGRPDGNGCREFVLDPPDPVVWPV